MPVGIFALLGNLPHIVRPIAAFASDVGPNVRVSSAPQIADGGPDVAVQGDRLVAVWHRTVERNKAGWGFSFDGGQSWVEGGGFPVPSPMTQQILRGQPSICVSSSGEYYAAVSFSMSPPFSRTVAVYRGVFQGSTLAWGQPSFALPFFGELNDVLSYDAPRIACDPDNGYLYLTCTRTDNLTADSYEYTIRFVRSVDGGQTWSAPLTLSGTMCSGSQTLVGPDGEVYVVWQDYAAGRITGRKSMDFGQNFDPEFAIASTHISLGSGPPGYCPTYGRVNPAYGACSGLLDPGFPAAVVDRSPGPHRGSLYLVWADGPEGTRISPTPGDVFETEPNDDFLSANPVAIGQDVRGVLFNSEDPGEPNDLYDTIRFDGEQGTTVWMHGVITSGGHCCVIVCPDLDLICGADTIQVSSLARTQLKPSWGGILPHMLFTLPTTGRYYARMAVPSGRDSYVYTLSLHELEIDPASVSRDHRDILLVSSEDGGQTWSTPIRVNDDPPFFDNSLPDVAVDELGQVHVAWYDRRSDLVCGELAQTHWAMSTNGGTSFEPSRNVSTQAGSWQIRPNSGDSDIGDRLALATTGETVHVLWTQTGRPDLDIFAAAVQPQTTPIALVQDFKAVVRGHEIAVSWHIADPSQILRLRLYRGTDNADAIQVGDWPAGQEKYEYQDKNATESTTYQYRLEVLYRDGTQEWIGSASVSLEVLPGLRWQMASPNPFRDTIDFELRSVSQGPARVRIFDVMGREVIILLRGVLAAGVTHYTWDGRNAQGAPVPGGTYFVEAGMDCRRTVQKIVRYE